MTKSLIAVLVFLIGIAVSMGFQNCGGSSLEANKSGNTGLRVDVDIDDDGTTDDGTDDDEDGEFAFNLNNGDNVFYMKGGGLSLDLSTSRILAKVYYTMLESHIYEQRGVTFTRDLPTAYCTNSALPHCAHTTSANCVGLGCYKSTTPVRCHWQKRMTTPEINNTFAALNTIEFLTRSVSPNDPMISDCNTPLLHFYRQDSTLTLSMANRACVPDGMYYTVNDSEDNVQEIFDNELSEIEALTNNQGDSELCNNYSAFSFATTKVSYSSASGFTRPEDSYSYQVNYEAQIITVNEEDVPAGFADIRFKEPGSNTVMCAQNVPVQPTEIAVIFPDDGLTYEVLRTTAVIADAPTAEITYEDPVDGGSIWRLFLTRATALTYSGGAIINSSQSDAIKDVMENVLVNRAKTRGLANPCPPAN